MISPNPENFERALQIFDGSFFCYFLGSKCEFSFSLLSGHPFFSRGSGTEALLERQG